MISKLGISLCLINDNYALLSHLMICLGVKKVDMMMRQVLGAKIVGCVILGLLHQTPDFRALIDSLIVTTQQDPLMILAHQQISKENHFDQCHLRYDEIAQTPYQVIDHSFDLSIFLLHLIPQILYFRRFLQIFVAELE